MATITLKGNPIHTRGELPVVGERAPDFRLTDADLSDVALSDFDGKVKILALVPSLDTGVCAASARRFNQEAGAFDGTVVLQISADLPFAQQRFCASEGLSNVIPLSTFRSPAFGEDYGVVITDGPLVGLISRAVVVLDRENRVVYTEQVPEIGQEPDYESTLQSARNAADR